MLIAIDYDGTYTEDPELWDKIIFLIKSHGHDAVIVTMRHPDESIDIDCQVIYTEREAKKSFCNNVGINPDIWIDDNPQWILQSSWGI